MYDTQLKALLTEKRDEAKERDEEISDGVYKALYDPKKPMVAPPVEEIPPYLNFAPLDQASDDLTDAAKGYDQAFESANGNSPEGLNADLIRSERVLTDERGLPNRPWFQHLLYAPGFYTGYGVKTIPGVREAIEQKKWTEADEQIGRVSAALEREADLLKQATKLLPEKKAEQAGFWTWNRKREARREDETGAYDAGNCGDCRVFAGGSGNGAGGCAGGDGGSLSESVRQRRGQDAGADDGGDLRR